MLFCRACQQILIGKSAKSREIRAKVHFDNQNPFVLSWCVDRLCWHYVHVLMCWCVDVLWRSKGLGWGRDTNSTEKPFREKNTEKQTNVFWFYPLSWRSQRQKHGGFNETCVFADSFPSDLIGLNHKELERWGSNRKTFSRKKHRKKDKRLLTSSTGKQRFQ
jgi:hypothetical protein